MYTVQVTDHIMIAHSLNDSYFGPAQQLHGATYVIDAIFISKVLNDKNVVIDIGEASRVLKSVIDPISYQNLDTLHQFRGMLTTTEYLANYIHGEVRKHIDDSIKLKIILHESHIASASYSDE